jgi:hypothetical protein
MLDAFQDEPLSLAFPARSQSQHQPHIHTILPQKSPTLGWLRHYRADVHQYRVMDQEN